MLQDVGQQVDGERHVVGQHAGVIGGLLARGVGVQLAADVLDRLGDAARRALLRALEGHVLEHVGDAVDLGRLVARAGVDPDADARGLHVGHGRGRDAQAVGKGGDLGSGSCFRHDGLLDVGLDRRQGRSAARRSARRAACRSARRAGKAGVMPVARCTASGNFPGCAVARHTRGVAGSSRHCRPTRMPTARVRIDQLAGRPQHLGHGGAGLLLAGARGIEQLPRAAERVRRHRELAGAPRTAPSAPRTFAPSRPHRSNSRRSKLLATWMSMLGLIVGWTSPALYSPLAKKRARMSLRLVATISWAIGRPICAAT